MAEYAIQRINRRLENLENRVSEVRLGIHGSEWVLAIEDRDKDAISAIEAEIRLQTARLRELLEN